MTRINADIPPRTLKRLHLIAELREITMVPASLRRSLRTKTPEEVLASIPKKFTLGAGHVKFFYDKMAFLHRRFDRLALEMEQRGYRPDWSRNEAFIGFDSTWYSDWDSTPEDDTIVIERINFRISQKPHLYED